LVARRSGQLELSFNQRDTVTPPQNTGSFNENLKGLLNVPPPKKDGKKKKAPNSWMIG